MSYRRSSKRACVPEYTGILLDSLINALESEKEAIDEEAKGLARLKEEFRKRIAALKEKRDEYIKKIEDQCRGRLSEFKIEIEEIEKRGCKKKKGRL